MHSRQNVGGVRLAGRNYKFLLSQSSLKMKKTLAALAVLSTFAGAAFAADVTVYGLVDLGLNYVHNDDGVNDATDKFTMNSGTNSGSRFGLKGEEDLGNGIKVGFVLENGFKADDGTLDNGGRLFGRESSLYITGAAGTLKFGRLTQMTSSTGTTGLMGGTVSAFSTGWNEVRGHKSVMAGDYTQYDNTIMYSTPSFAGFQVHAQYSFDTGVNDYEDGVEGQSTVDRYAAIGATYKAGALNLVGAIENYNYASYPSTLTTPDDDGLTVNFGGAYDFEVAKVYAVAQYFKHMSLWLDPTGANIDGGNHKYAKGSNWDNMQGFGINVSTGIPAFGGTAKFGLGYMDAEQCDDADMDLQRYTVSIGYDYNLSKRTMLYTGAGYTADNYGAKDADDAYTIGVVAGLVHKF